MSGYRIDVISEGGFLVGFCADDGSIKTVCACSALDEALSFVRNKIAPQKVGAIGLQAERVQIASGAIAHGASKGAASTALADDVCRNPNCWCGGRASAAHG